MDFSIKKCVAWSGDLHSSDDWKNYALGEIALGSTDNLPELKQIPAMQRRRLSPFAKLSMHCALTAADGYLDVVPSVFASRHGDLQKTSKLINDVAAKEVLSPTQFGLSVHNAVGGLFSIFTGNKAPQTAISAGEDTFFIALIDALCKLKSNDYPRILLVYTETVVPEIYKQYIKQDEISISTALLIEKMALDHDKSNKENQTQRFFSLEMKVNEALKSEEQRGLQVLDFLKFYYNNNDQVEVKSKRHLWTLSKK